MVRDVIARMPIQEDRALVMHVRAKDVRLHGETAILICRRLMAHIDEIEAPK